MTEHTISDVDGLREQQRRPSRVVLDKSIDHIDDAVRGLLARSPSFAPATTSDAGTDASPRGGPPGFVAAIDDQRLAFGDLSGNNRLDWYANLVNHPTSACCSSFLASTEWWRVNGIAQVSNDPAALERCAIDGRVPKVAIVVEVDECFIHCGKALRRTGLWDTSTWPSDDERPSAAAALNDHLGLGIDPKSIQDDLEANYQATMWLPAGKSDSSD